MGACVLQSRPPRGRKTSLEEAPRIATIHEYLDWTVTAEDALGERDLVRPLPCIRMQASQRCCIPCLAAVSLPTSYMPAHGARHEAHGQGMV